MSELDELQKPLTELELAEFMDVCSRYLTPKAMMIPRRLAFQLAQAQAKPSEDVQSVIDSLNKYCGVTPARQREIAKFIEFLVRENARIQRKAEQQLAQAQKKIDEYEPIVQKVALQLDCENSDHCNLIYDAQVVLGRFEDAATGNSEEMERYGEPE